MKDAKYDYCGEEVSQFLPIPLVEGWRDHKRAPFERSLYRVIWKEVLWKIGNWASRIIHLYRSS